MTSPGLMLCRIGWHKALGNGTWNQGYCFTTCSRCGRDMVRSLFGEWLVPADFRVVWRAKDAGGDGVVTAPAAPAEPVTPTARAEPTQPIAPAPPPEPAAQTVQTAVQPIVAPDPPPKAGQSPFDFAEFDDPSPEEPWIDRAQRRKV